MFRESACAGDEPRAGGAASNVATGFNVFSGSNALFPFNQCSGGEFDVLQILQSMGPIGCPDTYSVVAIGSAVVCLIFSIAKLEVTSESGTRLISRW